MESKAYIKNIKISPKKLRFLLSDIKKYKPADALTYLLYTPKKGARLFYKAIKSAVSNAKAKLNASEDSLQFETLVVEEGQKLKRYQAGGRGVVKPFVRRYAHIKIVLTAQSKEKLETKNEQQQLTTKKNETKTNKNSKKYGTKSKP